MPRFFIAHRFLQNITKERHIASMLIICVMSIIFSTFALTLIIAIANGLQQATTQALQGFHSDCTIQAPAGTALNFAKIAKTLHKECSTLVAHAAPVAYQHAILQKNRSDDISHVVLVQGIDPQRDAQTRPALRLMHPTNDALWRNNSVVIGATLARDLAIKPGDTINLLVPADEQDDNHSIQFSSTQVTISNMFTSGIEAMDERMIFCSLTTLQFLFPETGVTQINIRLQPGTSLADASKQLQQRLKLNVVAWRDLYPALLDALAVEHTAMLLIVFLVAVIASIATVALLMMYSVHQQQSIALLIAMGMRLRDIRTLFTLIGVTITSCATVVGILFACAASWLLEHYRLIRLPDVYYVDHVPAQMDISTALLVFSIMVFVSLITSWLATGQVKKMNLSLLLKR